MKKVNVQEADQVQGTEAQNENVEATATETTATETTATEVVDIEKMSLEDIAKLPADNSKGNVYNTYDKEKEVIIQKGVELLAPKTSPALICIIKFWNDRAKLKVVMRKIKELAISKGVDPDTFIQNLRDEMNTNEAIEAAYSQGRYALNYFKPRKNAQPKGKSIQVSIGGVVYTVSEIFYKIIKSKVANGELDKVEAGKQLIESAAKPEVEDFL